MRPTRAASILLLAAAGVLGACARDTTTAPGPGARAVRAAAAAAPGRYLVLFAANAVPADFAVRVVALGGTVTASHGGAGLATVSGLDAAAASQLAGSAGVSQVQPDTEIALDVPVQPAQLDLGKLRVASQANPTLASRYGWQWNMRLIRADQAWAAGKLGSPGVTVAILDTGIDYDAPDLAGLVDMTRSVSFVASDNQSPQTYFPKRSPISDYNGHGTNVATQVSSNAAALAGVTSRTTLMAVKVLDGQGDGWFSDILNGVLWAADHGADVANMSLGGAFYRAGNGRFIGLINRIFNYAAQKGVLIVVAAGNESWDLDHDGNLLDTFCDEPQVVCVSAVGPATATGSPDAFAFYSNYGRSAVNVAGPGGNADAAHGFAPSLWPWGYDNASWVWSYCSKTMLVIDSTGTVQGLAGCQSGRYLTGYIGTSQATPHVAGLAALLVAQVGHGQPSLIRNLIMQSAVDLGQPGTDPFYGSGRIDVARALGL